VDKIKLNTPIFGYGRDKVLFGSYLNDAKKKGEKLPSPNKYYIKPPRSRVGGQIGVRLKTEFDANKDKLYPGPGTYKLNVMEMANSSAFVLSTFKFNSNYLENPHRRSTIIVLVLSRWMVRERKIEAWSFVRINV
jgi:hypothetical protein